MTSVRLYWYSNDSCRGPYPIKYFGVDFNATLALTNPISNVTFFLNRDWSNSSLESNFTLIDSSPFQ